MKLHSWIYLSAIGLFAVTMALVSCGQANETTAEPAAPESEMTTEAEPETATQDSPQLPETEGEALWNYLQAVNYRQDWEMWPGKSEFYEGTEPHGVLLTTYVNGTALQAINGDAETMPSGAIVAKENYTPDKSLAATTVMYKQEGFNPEAGDWFWAKYGPEGGIQASGAVDSCIECHSSASANDYLFTGQLGSQ